MKKITLEEFKQELNKLVNKVDKSGFKCIIAYNFIDKDLQAFNLMSTDIPLLEFPSSLMRWAGKMERFINEKGKLNTSELHSNQDKKE